MKARSRKNDWAAAALAAALGALPGGCALSDLPDEPRPAAAPAAHRPARSAPTPLRGAEPVQVFLSRGTVTDSDSDGYPDTIPVVTYLFPDPNASAIPVWAEGEFEFRLIDADQRLVARWVFPADVAATSRQRLPPGPAYSFFLRLGGDDDRMTRRSLELSAIFRSASGGTASSQGSAAVQLGLD